MLEQRLAGPHASEDHGLHVDLQGIFPGGNAGKRRGFERARVRVLGAAMRPARGLASDRRGGASARACARGAGASKPRLRIQPAITSPATAPNTVELATPFPPSRFAPCTPPASSPATKSPDRTPAACT